MRQKPETKQSHGAKVLKDIRRATRNQYSAEEKIRIVLRAQSALTVISLTDPQIRGEQASTADSTTHQT